MEVAKKSAWTISPAEYPLPRWRYILLFQSWTQLLSYLLMVSIVAGLFIGVFAMFGMARHPLHGLLPGMAIGALFAVLTVVPMRFTVTPASDAALRQITEQLDRLRYLECRREHDIIVYRQDLPRLLRWDEANISIARDAGSITVSGGSLVLKRLRSALAALAAN